MNERTFLTKRSRLGSSDLKTVIFLRRPNIDSSLCLAFHGERAQRNALMHPLGRADKPVPQVILDASGKTSADGHMVFCQTCHEPHGATNAAMLVLPPSKLCNAYHADKAPETKPAAGAPVHSIGHTYPGFQPPTTLLKEKTTFGPNGELGCLSYHRLHDASGARPLLIRKNEGNSLCIECHKEEERVINSRHDLRLSSPETVCAMCGTKQPANPACGSCHAVHRNSRGGGFWIPGLVSRRDFGRSLYTCCRRQDQCGAKHIPRHTDRPEIPPLNRAAPGQPSHMPTLDVRSEPSPRGIISCLICHDPHTGPPTPGAKTGASERRNKFFRPAEQRKLCADCHGIEALWRFFYYYKDQRNPHPERKMNPISADTKP